MEYTSTQHFKTRVGWVCNWLSASHTFFLPVLVQCILTKTEHKKGKLMANMPYCRNINEVLGRFCSNIWYYSLIVLISLYNHCAIPQITEYGWPYSYVCKMNIILNLCKIWLTRIHYILWSYGSPNVNKATNKTLFHPLHNALQLSHNARVQHYFRSDKPYVLMYFSHT